MPAIVHHINCGLIMVSGFPPVACHCLALETADGIVLVDSGLGLRDVAAPAERFGQELIDGVGFRFYEQNTAVAQLAALGFTRDAVRHIVLTHGDPDHAGGLGDFPRATVHVGAEELASIQRSQERYLPCQFEPLPRWMPHGPSAERWFGLEARPIFTKPAGVHDADAILLISLPGHTVGHCGVAVRTATGWLLHVGDAYYLRAELEDPGHPVSALAAARAQDDGARRETLEQLRRLVRDHRSEVSLTGYHDFSEFERMPEVAGI